MNDLYEQMNFILSGGALKLLTDFLSSRVSAALVVEPRDADLELLDAIGTKPEKLMMLGEASRLQRAFSSAPPIGEIELEQAPLDGEWPWAVRMRGAHWTLYVLFRERADDALLASLRPYAGLVRLWHAFQMTNSTEKRLARLSYMILATKSTLASIFEPMPLEYYASFVADVLRESLFPRSISIFKDDGNRLALLSGASQVAPARTGVYAQSILTNTPVVTRADAVPYEVVLPLAEADIRLFCVMEWNELPKEEALNFLELLGNLAARAIAINRLKLRSSKVESQVTSDQFTLHSLSNVLAALRKETDRQKFFSLVADIFLEIGQMRGCFLAVRGPDQSFAPVLYRKDAIAAPFGNNPMFCSGAELDDPNRGFYTLQPEGPEPVLNALGLVGDCPWEEMPSLRYLFPFRTSQDLSGFIAIGDGAPLDEMKLSALKIVAQFVGLGLEKF